MSEPGDITGKILVPIETAVLLEPVSPEEVTSTGGIILPGDDPRAKRAFTFARVITTGEGITHEQAVFMSACAEFKREFGYLPKGIPLDPEGKVRLARQPKRGDLVYVNRYGQDVLKIEGEAYLLVDKVHLNAILESKQEAPPHADSRTEAPARAAT